MKERIDLDFFARALYPSHLQARGDTLYCIGKRADLERNAYDSDLYRLTDGLPERLTASADVKDYALLEDGIVFASLRTDKDKEAAKGGEPLTVFQRLPYGAGEAQEHLRLPHTVVQAEWLPGGKLLFRAVLDHTLQSFLTAYDGDMEKALKDRREQDEALTVVDELPFWFNGQGYINKKRSALYLYDGHGTRLLTDPYAEVDRVVLSADRTKALFTQRIYQHVAPEENQLMQLDIATAAITPVTGIPAGETSAYAFGPSGQVLFAFREKDHPYGLNANARLTSIPLAGGVPTRLDNTPDATYNYYNSVGSDAKLGDVDPGLVVDGQRVLFLSTLRNDSHVIAYDLKSGEFAQVTDAPGMVEEFVPYQGGVALIAMRGDALGEVYTIGAEGGAQERQISRLNDGLLDGYEVVTPLAVSYTNSEGIEIDGWVMPPVGYVPGKVYPAILDIHGGPKTVYGSVFFHEMQYWCAQGYAVLFCNPTGGDGRGDKFADIRGKYGTIDYEDIMAFVDKALTQFGFISALQMGVTGGSYGGFMTNWIIGHTDRFQAAASQRSIANWLGFFNTSDIGYTFDKDQMDGTPWDSAEKLWKHSPVKYADNVHTPTLFIHSEEDYRCNMFEGIQMFYALRYHGVDTRLCLFKDENHELSRSGKPKNRVRRLQEITRWMDKHLKA